MSTQIPAIRGLPDTRLTMPEMVAGDVDSIRLRGTLSKALPPMPQIKDMAMSPAKFIDAMEVANDTREAYRHSRIADKRMRAVAKAKNYQATKAVERRARDVSRFNSKQVRAQANAFTPELINNMRRTWEWTAASSSDHYTKERRKYGMQYYCYVYYDENWQATYVGKGKGGRMYFSTRASGNATERSDTSVLF